ncbi:MAG: polyphosphate polymerase domain-containing protein [Algibacter sp.]
MNTGKQQSKYRYERKFIIKPEAQYDFLLQLSKSGFSELHYERTINNIYLDDYNFNSVIDNIEGVSNRKKTRIRWYGDILSNSEKVIEFKIKSSDVNRKENIPLLKRKLDSLDNSSSFWEAIKNELEANNNHKYYSHQLFTLQPTLINSYRRNYYLNADESIRVTLDRDLFYYSPIYQTEAHDQHLVIEFKYNSEQILGENLINNLVLTKYSKYVKGILATSTFKPTY